MEPATVLVVEDDEEIAELMRLYLELEGLRTEIVSSAEAALDVLNQKSPSLILLDVNLPGIDGFDFLRGMRSRSNLPVIMVSSRDSDEDKLNGLTLGADDFVTKPFSPRFLAAKVQALLRRVPAPKTQVAFGPFALDTESRRLTKDGVVIDLRRKEWDLLEFLVRHPGEAYRPEDLYREIWGQEFGDLTTVAVHIQRLRTKLSEPSGAPRYIQTKPGFGYAFIPAGP